MTEMGTVYDEDGREMWTVARLKGSGLWGAEEILSWAKGRFRH